MKLPFYFDLTPVKQREQYQFCSPKGRFNYCYKRGSAEDAKAGGNKSAKIKREQSILLPPLIHLAE